MHAMGTHVAIYVRPASDGISIADQVAGLKEVARRHQWTVVGTYEDGGSSGGVAGSNRPALAQALRDAEMGRHDKLVVWSVDRLAESLTKLDEAVSAMGKAKVSLYVHRRLLDTDSKPGAHFFSIVKAAAELDREIRSGSIKEGLRRSSKSGTQTGRPRLAPDVERQIRDLRARGLGIRATASRAKVGVSAVQRIVRESEGK